MALEHKRRALDGDSPAPAKRRRIPTLPTPPESDLNSPGSNCKLNDETSGSLIERATYFLEVQAIALGKVRDLYKSDPGAEAALDSSVSAIVTSQRAGGKLVTCAVGKSAHLARKLSATCKSLGIRTSFLHGCEAAHGDLGDVEVSDVILFVSYSGRTPELLNLLPHLPPSVSLLAISGHVRAEDCALLHRGKSHGILLPAPLYESEEESFGIAAPTTSTVVALAVGDMLALMLSEALNGESTKTIFKRNHPGGAIGISAREIESLERDVQLDVSGGLLSPDASAEDDA